MNILFFIRSLDPGGAERQLSCLASGLAERGHRVTILTFYSGGALERSVRERGVSVFSLGKKSRWDLIKPVLRLVQAVHRQCPDILHAYMPSANLLALMFKPFLRPAKIVIGVRASDMSLDHYDRTTALNYRLERHLAKLADRVICNSHAAAKVYLEYVSDKALNVIPNGIDTETYAPGHTCDISWRATWGFSSEVQIIGLVARADPMKDHDTFLRAVAIARDLNPRLKFVCIGRWDSPMAKTLQTRAKSLGVESYVIWVGPFSNMEIVYPTLDLVTLSSQYGEGFPNVIAESMACGVPCVVTKVGDAAEVVGNVGRVVPPKDPRALATAWIDILQESSTLTNEAARNRIVQNFSIDLLVTRSEALFREIIDA